MLLHNHLLCGKRVHLCMMDNSNVLFEVIIKGYVYRVFREIRIVVHMHQGCTVL